MLGLKPFVPVFDYGSWLVPVSLMETSPRVRWSTVPKGLSEKRPWGQTGKPVLTVPDGREELGKSCDFSEPRFANL